MPQMMPINWIFSLLIFIMIFLLFNMMNYYNTPNININKKLKYESIKLNNFSWKW